MRRSETVVAYGLNINKNDYEAISKDCYSRMLVPKVDEANRVCELRRKNYTVLKYFPDSICDLDGLKTLDLGYSSFRWINCCIGNLENLESLNLSYASQLSTLPSSIGKLQNLKVLCLRETNCLSALPEEIGNLGSLEVLELLGSAITTIPSSIGNLSNLKKLDLRSARNLLFLPEEIGNLVALEELVLTDAGEIKRIPSSIGQLHNLKRLFLSHLELESLPEEIGNLGSLEYFSVANSKITSLPSSFGKLQNLRLLSLNCISTLSKLPIEIRDLANLVCLDVEGSNISTLPTWFGELKNLRYLEYDFCIQRSEKEERDRNANKVRMFVKQHPSLLHLGGWYDENITNALLHNKVRFHILKTERTPGLWAYLLKNARTAFRAGSIALPSVVAYYYRQEAIYQAEDDSISAEDAIYQLLTLGIDIFIRALVGRRTMETNTSTTN